jgi:hypothetical protein
MEVPMRELSQEEGYGELLLLIAWRKLIAGQGRCPALLRELAKMPGSQPEDLLRTLAIFFGALNDGCRRPLSVAPIGCSAATHDEQHILALLAASQQDQTDLVAAHLLWLVQPSHQKAVGVAARILGLMLKKADIILTTPRLLVVPANPVLQIVA